MRSSFEKIGMPIDCKKLVLTGNYYGLTKYEVIAVVESFFCFITNHFEKDCILDFESTDGVMKYEKIKTISLDAGHMWHMNVQGNVKNAMVHNKKSFRRFMQIMELAPEKRCSKEFDYFYKSSILPFIDDSDKLLKAARELYDQEFADNVRANYDPEILGNLCANSMLVNKNLFQGEFELHILLYCLDDIDRFIGELQKFAEMLLMKVLKINMGISIEQTLFESKTYLGVNYSEIIVDETNSNAGELFELREAVDALYLKHLGGMLFLSPITAQLLSTDDVISCKKIAAITENSNGSIVLVLNKPIYKMTIQDFRRLKECLYNSLTLINCEYEIETSFLQWQLYSVVMRPKGEYIPVLNRELSVTGKKVSIQGTKCYNYPFLFKWIKRLKNRSEQSEEP